MKREFFGFPISRWLALLGALALLAALSWWIHDSLQLEWTVNSLRSAVERAGIWGPVLFVGILMFRFAVLIPSSVLLTGAGICFGSIPGTIYATIGLTMSALLKFGFASVLGRDVLLRQLPPSWRAGAALGTHRATATGLALVCAYPLGPKHIFQIAAILSGIPLGRYLLAVSSGAVLRAAAFSFFGEAWVTGNDLLLFSFLLGGSVAIPLLIPGWRRWLFAPANEGDKVVL